MSEVTEQNQADAADRKVVAWKTWVVTSLAAILTGFAAYYSSAPRTGAAPS